MQYFWLYVDYEVSWLHFQDNQNKHDTKIIIQLAYYDVLECLVPKALDEIMSINHLNIAQTEMFNFK